MVVVVSCPCGNVSVNSSKQAEKSDGAAWAASFSLAKGVQFGVCNLVGGGIDAKVEGLLRSQEVAGKEGQWVLSTCANCSTVVALCNKDDASFVNLALRAARVPARASPVWGIALATEEANPEDILDVPDSRETERYETYKAILEQAAVFLEVEEQNMLDRVDEYERKQQKALHDLQARVYRDQRTLWKAVDAERKAAQQLAKAQAGTESANKVEKKMEETAGEEEKAREEEKAKAGVGAEAAMPPPPSSPAPEPPSSTKKDNQQWLRSRGSRNKLSGDFVFALDDDEPSDVEIGEKYGESDSDDGLPAVDEEDIDEDDYYEPRPAAMYQMASSLPVQIPRALMGFGTRFNNETSSKASGSGSSGSSRGSSKGSPAPAGGSQLPRINPIAHQTYQSRASLERKDADAMMLSKSFAIPDSRDTSRLRKFVF